MQSVYPNFDIFQILEFATAANLDDQIMLIDNFDSSAQIVKGGFLDYPIRLTFSISIICLAGSMSFKINLNEYTLHTNDMLIVQTGDFGEFLAVSDDCRIIIIAFTDEYFHNTLYPGASVSLQRLFHDSPLCRLNSSVVDEAVTVYKMMKAKILQSDNPYRKGAIMGYMQVLLYDAYYYFDAVSRQMVVNDKKTSRKEEIFNRFIAAVQKDYRKHRSIMHYADILCISSKYLSQIALQVSGKLAGEWIADYVILEAKALLKSRQYSIQQVSELLNFPTQSFFGRYFKDKVGCSPSAYQKQP